MYMCEKGQREKDQDQDQVFIQCAKMEKRALCNFY